MARSGILQSGQSYTFRSYFEMSHEPDEILAEFGVSLEKLALNLPQASVELEPITALQQAIQRRLPYISLTSEAARRETLIAPVVLNLIDYTQAQLRIEYTINVSEQLKGALDYLLQTQKNLLVIEAKNADLARGFTQLAVELIALDQWVENDTPVLYGVISTGDVWQFGCFHRTKKLMQQDLTLYRVPTDLQELFSILVALL
ncbi:MAG: hypothetical protein AAF821_11370 [Cyanobacteria bacterium P01_D01_bin.156]